MYVPGALTRGRVYLAFICFCSSLSSGRFENLMNNKYCSNIITTPPISRNIRQSNKIFDMGISILGLGFPLCRVSCRKLWASTLTLSLSLSIPVSLSACDKPAFSLFNYFSDIVHILLYAHFSIIVDVLED